MAGHTHEPFMLIPDDASAETLKSLLPKIQTLNSSLPQAKLSLLGYDQWIPYTENDLKMQLHAADTYILTSSYYYPHTSAATAFDQSYKQWFKTSLLNSQPRMAPLGYDFSFAKAYARNHCCDTEVTNRFALSPGKQQRWIHQSQHVARTFQEKLEHCKNLYELSR